MGDLDIGVKNWRTKGERRDRLFVLGFEEREKVFGCLTEVGVVSYSRVRDGMGKPLKGDGVSCGVGRCDENVVAAVVVRGETNVVTGEAVGSEGAALAWCFVE